MNKYIKMKCQDCGATMEVDPDKHMIFCPYCGSKHLIEESDDVKIAKIHESAETVRNKDTVDAEVEKERIKANDISDKGMVAIFAIVAVFVVICLLIALIA